MIGVEYQSEPFRMRAQRRTWNNTDQAKVRQMVTQVYLFFNYSIFVIFCLSYGMYNMYGTAHAYNSPLCNRMGKFELKKPTNEI